MIFNNHSNLEGQHAFLGASKYHWINYDETKVADAYSKFLATQRGTVLHDFACQCITLTVVSILSVFVLIIPFLGWIAFPILQGIIWVIKIISFFQICSGKAKEPAIIRSFGFLR